MIIIDIFFFYPKIFDKHYCFFKKGKNFSFKNLLSFPKNFLILNLSVIKNMIIKYSLNLFNF